MISILAILHFTMMVEAVADRMGIILKIRPSYSLNYMEVFVFGALITYSSE